MRYAAIAIVALALWVVILLVGAPLLLVFIILACVGVLWGWLDERSIEKQYKKDME